MATETITQVEREVVELLARRPAPEDIIAFHPSQEATDRFYMLIEVERERELSDAEQQELDTCMFIEHFMRLMKVEAHRQLGASAQ